MSNTLTKTEEKITRLRLRGMLRKEIANCLSRSEETICTHLKNIYQKTHVQNEIELYNWYCENILNINIRKMLQVVVLVLILSPSVFCHNNDIQRPLRVRTSRTSGSARRGEMEPDYLLFN